jgi:TrmH family RNA methyltransferase
MEITSKQNTYIKEYRKLTEQRKYRRQTGYFVCEGAKLAVEAVKSGCALGENAYFTAAAAEKYPECISLLRESCKMVQISEEVADSISDTKSPQGIFITVRHLDKILNLSTIDSSRQFIILENLQDMGNIGTIIRSCDAFSIDGVILAGDCADVFAPKTVRSAMGSLFRLPIYCCDTEEAITLLQKGGFTVYSVKLGEEKLPQKTAVVIGNEGNGVSDTVKKLCDKSLFIPISSAESLNASVAASVIAWEMSKVRQ